VQAFHFRLDLRHELDRAGAGADHGNAFAREVVVVIPGRRVKEGALEITKARDIGQLGLVQRSGAGDQDSRGQRAAGGFEAPARGHGIPAGALHLAPEAGVLEQPLLGGGSTQIVLNFGLRGERLTPPGIRRE
jgi:hypothetical protein